MERMCFAAVQLLLDRVNKKKKEEESVKMCFGTKIQEEILFLHLNETFYV